MSDDDRLATLEVRSEERHAHHREALDRIDTKMTGMCLKMELMLKNIQHIEIAQVEIKEEILREARKYTNKTVGLCLAIPGTIFILMKVFG